MITDFDTAVKNIRRELKEYLLEHDVKALIIGISGGIDSTVVAALARPICSELKIPLIGRSLPIVSNTEEEIKRAKFVGQLFMNEFREVDLSNLYEQTVADLFEDIENADTSNPDYKIRLGNIKARIRMMYLYDLASQKQGLVLSADNFTEHLLGFWTLHGDVGDFGMIRNVWKTEIYQMAKYLALSIGSHIHTNAILDCIDAVPTDGLGITESDLDQIGTESYWDADELLMDILNNTIEEHNLNHPLVVRYHKNKYKQQNPNNIPREKVTSESLFKDDKYA